jgi:hypothetical protein
LFNSCRTITGSLGVILGTFPFSLGMQEILRKRRMLQIPGEQMERMESLS